MPPTAAPTPPASGPTRRGLLVLGTAALAGAGAVAVTGCEDLGAVVHGAPVTVDPDTVVVDQAVLALQGGLAAVRRTLRRHPGLRPALKPVLALHTAHLDALKAASPTPSVTPSPTQSASPSARPSAGGSPSPSAPAAPVPAQPRAALAGVAAGERALRARLTGLALASDSGALARLLGAMAAGTSQRLAAWPA